ncbi:MAG: hypothetical protein Gaeavirus23_8 [Gaeavirus sp.]|uniref:Uncharacterized protein n=1 Tax=Gaeavirus sp. TaxID=2487767 RepID=A0A3G5A471_9VIRU|nr:MAG: hypothetical protein Gaeavirus23_8 [Gaeavirus sp.]
MTEDTMSSEYDEHEIIKHNYDISVSTIDYRKCVDAVLKSNFDLPTHHLSMAELNDHVGDKYHIEYEGELTYEFTKTMIEIFLSKYTCDRFFRKDTYDSLMENGYYVCIYDKYYHFCLAIDYESFELESKGTCGSMMDWNGHDGSTNHQISETGEHMWNDRYSITCNVRSCYTCHEDTPPSDEDSDE